MNFVQHLVGITHCYNLCMNLQHHYYIDQHCSLHKQYWQHLHKYLLSMLCMNFVQCLVE